MVGINVGAVVGGTPMHATVAGIPVIEPQVDAAFGYAAYEFGMLVRSEHQPLNPGAVDTVQGTPTQQAQLELG